MILKLRLYVSGATETCNVAVRSAQFIFQQRLDLACELEVIDVREAPDLAQRDGIRATPTLVMLSPGPVRRILGDLSDADDVLGHLGVAPAPEPDQARRRALRVGLGRGH
jgi:circadian clock protein KaiB